MAEELTKLRKKRGQIRTKLTNFCKFIEAKENNTKVSEIELRLNIIERAFDEFDNIQSDLEILDENEDIERAPTHDLFCEAISLARDILKGNSPSSLTSSNVTQLHLNTPENMLTNDAEAHIRLPTIGLPTFNGSYDKWLNFRDTFTALIHENQRLSNIQKLFYLKSCLQDEAARLIESLQTATENYLIAWDLLKKRYENKRVIVNTHIKALFDLTLNTHNLHFSLRQLLDHLLQHLSALDNLESAEKQRDMLIIHLMYSKLDQKTKVEFENTLQDDNIPTLTDFKDFLTKKCFTLETMHSSSASTLNKFVKLDYKGNKQTQRTFAVTNTENKSKLCLYCQGMHFIFQCSKFVALSVDEKYREVRKLKICSNCLRPGHFKNECKSGNCKICSRDHNTLLHNNNYHKQNSDASQKQDARNQRNPEETQQKQTVAQVVNKETSFESVRTVNASCNRSQVLLSTAHVLIKDQHGTWHDCRALCDSGSQSNLITTALCQTLNLRCENTNVPLAGINENLIEIKQRATTSIKSRFNSFETELNLLVIPKITERLPTTAFDDKLLGYPKTLHLADPEFNKPRSVDILLGADIFFELLCIGQIKLGKHMPTLQKTQLGWIFAGNLNLEQKLNNKLVCNFTGEISNENLNHQLTQFWEIEEIVPQQILTTEEKICEIQFAEDTTRNEQGRYVVKLPFSENLQNLGESKTMALKRFNALESRFDRDTSLKLDYIAFMREYEDLGHMSEQEIFDLDNNEKDYFLPHHAVRKQTSTTTKCRVVFDASAKTDTGISLNDTLLVGPKIQSDLFSIVMRFRLHQLVLSADIKMMFRQILVHEDHQGYQKIIWRYDKTEPLKIYTLKTITYGMASSPYLAQKCLVALANEYEKMFPRTSQIIKNSFYMDDLLVSVKTKEEAMEIQCELKIILGSAGFHLRKWSSNDKSFLREILGTDDNADNLVQFHDNNPLKTLGLEWNANSDTFHYTIQPNTNLSRITKRTVLSSISQIFDPLGLVGPAIMKAKILMQRLWQLQIGWDESLPSNLHSAWYNFITQLNNINRKHINTTSNMRQCHTNRSARF